MWAWDSFFLCRVTDVGERWKSRVRGLAQAPADSGEDLRNRLTDLAPVAQHSVLLDLLKRQIWWRGQLAASAGVGVLLIWVLFVDNSVARAFRWVREGLSTRCRGTARAVPRQVPVRRGGG
jgi:hypothetical protein